MRLLVRASTVRAPTVSPPHPRVYGVGLDRDRATATAAPTDSSSEARGRDRDRGTAQPQLVRPAQDGDRGRATPLVRGLGQDKDRATATAANAPIGYAYATSLVAERHDDLAAATITNHVLRLHLTQTWLKAVASGGHVQSASAYDLIFETTAAVRLDHEIESYSATIGDLWVAIRLPSWAVTTDQFLFRARYGAAL